MAWRLNLRQLEAFRALMLTGTTTRAARALHVSQPVVSRLIQELEAHLGVALFEREKGRLVPTEHAAWLFSEAEETMARLDKLDSAVRNAPRSPRRPLQLVVNSAMSFSVIPAAIADFRRRYPGRSISTDIVTRRDNRRWINDQNFDLAVTMLPIEYPEEAVQALVRVPAVCIMPTGHPLEARASVRPQDLDGCELVALPPDNLTPARLNSLCEKLGVSPVLAVEAQTVLGVSACVAEGLGVAIVDPYTAARCAPLGVSIRPFDAPLDYVFGVVYPLQRAHSPLIEGLVTCIAARLRAVAGRV
jgi:DNA-binding transcriptional LysR family regulator